MKRGYQTFETHKEAVLQEKKQKFWPKIEEAKSRMMQRIGNRKNKI